MFPAKPDLRSRNWRLIIYLEKAMKRTKEKQEKHVGYNKARKEATSWIRARTKVEDI